jgi:hypothetical protein
MLGVIEPAVTGSGSFCVCSVDLAVGRSGEQGPDEPFGLAVGQFARTVVLIALRGLECETSALATPQPFRIPETVETGIASSSESSGPLSRNRRRRRARQRAAGRCGHAPAAARWSGPGDRVKTDTRHALERLLAAGHLQSVVVPEPVLEGLRDLVGCREDLRGDLMACWDRISELLLRRGPAYPGPGAAWTRRHASRLGTPVPARLAGFGVTTRSARILAWCAAPGGVA